MRLPDEDDITVSRNISTTREIADAFEEQEHIDGEQSLGRPQYRNCK